MKFILYLFILGFTISWAQEIDYSVNQISPDLLENAHAVVRTDEMRIHIKSLKNVEFSQLRAVTVLDEQGNKFVRAYAGYNNSTKIKNIWAEIYDSTGRQIDKVKQKDFADVSAVDGATLYTDSRVMYMGYTPTSYPYTVVFGCESVSENSGWMPYWNFMDGFRVSTENSFYEVTSEVPGVRPLIKERSFEGFEINKQEMGASVSYSAKNLLALKEESLSPEFTEIVPNIMVMLPNFYHEGYNGKINNWHEAGKWIYNNLLIGRDELNPATVAMAKSLVAGVEDDLEKAKIIYDYVQKNTRYISVQVGIGGLQPITAIEVDNLKYGDCKGLTNYTKALLKAVGVTSYYTHVEAGKTKISFEEDFADLGQGNHVILAIPYDNRYYWVDCTSQLLPFGFIGDFTDDRKVLVIKPEGGELTTTQAYLNEQNQQVTTAQIALNNDGSIAADIEILTKDWQYDQRFYLVEETDLNIEKYYKNYWSNVNNLILQDYTFENKKENVSFLEKVKISARNYGVKANNDLLISVNMFNKNEYIPNRYRNRKHPLEISRGYLDEDKYTIIPPEGYELSSLPEPILIENKFGRYKVSFEQDSGNLIYHRELYVAEGRYKNTEYNAYRDFRREVSRNDNIKVLFKKI
jgi:hypothetical protein